MLTAHICEVLTGTLERLESKFATKTEGERQAFLQARCCAHTLQTERCRLRLTPLSSQDSAFGLFKAETRTTLEMRQAAVTRDYDAVRADLDKIRADMKYEVDKIVASQRLDLNLEKGRIRDELLSSATKAMQTESRLDKQINEMRTNMEAAKSDVIRFCVGAVASTTAIGLGVLRMLV